jgi:hypothetical protein
MYTYNMTKQLVSVYTNPITGEQSGFGYSNVDSFTDINPENGKSSMRYTNQSGGDAYIDIEYDPGKGSYHGTKYINGESIQQTVGVDWKMFFVNLTANGLAKGESCNFEKITEMDIT